MYLDKEMISVDHLCCMAHTRAKFKYAYEISGDEDARYILSLFAQLYAEEDAFKKAGLTPEQIRQARRLPGYLDIIGQLRSKLETLSADGHPPGGELMEKAVRYLGSFWKQLFRYLVDGLYSIDNNIAERNPFPRRGAEELAVLRLAQDGQGLGHVSYRDSDVPDDRCLGNGILQDFLQKNH